jgi:single-strand DNA-binding protein
MNESTLTVIGNVVDTPQRRKTDGGVSVTSFRVASTARRFDKQEGRWIDGESLYLKVTCWRSLADNVDRSVVKGDPIVVTGRLFTRLYEVEGQRRSSFELDAMALGLDLTRGVAAFSRTRPTAAPTYEVDDAAAGTTGELGGEDADQHHRREAGEGIADEEEGGGDGTGGDGTGDGGDSGTGDGGTGDGGPASRRREVVAVA